jgi:hypothetical protein
VFAKTQSANYQLQIANHQCPSAPLIRPGGAAGGSARVGIDRQFVLYPSYALN